MKTEIPIKEMLNRVLAVSVLLQQAKQRDTAEQPPAHQPKDAQKKGNDHGKKA